MNLSIESVDVVKNRYLQELFEDKRQDLKKSEGSDVKSLLLFHGTPQENIASILRDNFNLAKKVNGRKYGDGVYFSEQPEVSVGYTNTGFNIAGKWVGKKAAPSATQQPVNPAAQIDAETARPSLILCQVMTKTKNKLKYIFRC